MPCCHSVYWPHSPLSLRFSSSGTKEPVFWSITAKASSRIVFQFLSNVWTETSSLLRLPHNAWSPSKVSVGSHPDQVGVPRLLGRPPRLSLQPVHVVEGALPHRRKVTSPVTQLVPAVSLRTFSTKNSSMKCDIQSRTIRNHLCSIVFIYV